MQTALNEVMRTLKPIASEWGTEHAQVCELACLIADPGAPQQPLHSDTVPDSGQGSLLTMFIALQDIRG